MAVYHVLNCPCYAVSFLIGLCLTTTFSGITFAFQEDELDDSFEGEDIIDIGSLEEHLKTTSAESARDEEQSENESSSSHIPSLHTPYCTGYFGCGEVILQAVDSLEATMKTAEGTLLTDAYSVNSMVKLLNAMKKRDKIIEHIEEVVQEMIRGLPIPPEVSTWLDNDGIGSRMGDIDYEVIVLEDPNVDVDKIANNLDNFVITEEVLESIQGMVNSVLSGDKEGEGGTGAGETSRYPQGRDTRGQAEGFVSDDFHGRSSKQDRDTREEELARDAYIEQVAIHHQILQVCTQIRDENNLDMISLLRMLVGKLVHRCASNYEMNNYQGRDWTSLMGSLTDEIQSLMLELAEIQMLSTDERTEEDNRREEQLSERLLELISADGGVAGLSNSRIHNISFDSLNMFGMNGTEEEAEDMYE